MVDRREYFAISRFCSDIRAKSADCPLRNRMVVVGMDVSSNITNYDALEAQVKEKAKEVAKLDHK